MFILILLGKEYSRDDLRQRIGDISQIAGIRSYTLNEGLAKGVDALEVRTGSGLSFTVLPGRAMDIAWLEYKGVPFGYITNTGVTHPQFYHPVGYEWLRSFCGGMLTTCGLTHVGPPETDGIWELGLHGRISNIPAMEVSHHMAWEGDDPVFRVEGRMRESVLYEENLVLMRRITARGGDSKLIIEDEIENQGYRDTPFMILYHMNLGFPLISENSRLIASIDRTSARDDDAEKGIGSFDHFEAPTPDYAAQVFFHELAADKVGNTSVAVVNDVLNIGFRLRFNRKELPYFTQWKMMGQQDYVAGLEPGNCTPTGRSAARKNGSLVMLKPGEKRNVRLELEILNT